MGQSESRVEPEGQSVTVAPAPSAAPSGAKREFTEQEAKDFCKKIQDEVNRNMSFNTNVE